MYLRHVSFKMFQRGDLVWGKMKTYPWWPAIILDAKDCGKKQSKNKMWLFWFGDNKISELECERIVTFEDNYLKNTSKRSGKLFKSAVQEILKVKAYQQHLALDDISSLHEWAVSGFKKSSVSRSIKKYDINGLPEVVINALESLQSKNIIEDDSDDEEKDPVYEVQRGLKKLYEICIACCKSGSRIVSQHPLFLGGLCVLCTKTVHKVCRLPFGQAQDFCILCGLGGKLVYCSNSLCVRAYCNVCIDYLAPEGAYSQIVQNDTWVCYLCKSDPDKSCLIKRQKNYETIMYTPPQPSKEKLPICVISQSDICLKVLMKEKIMIEKYCIQPCKDAEFCEHTKYSEKYEDFSEKEFADIGADLVCGSYVSNGNLEDRKACVADFFVAFFRFIFRLDNARLHKPYVFFIFIANASIMDEEILTRAQRFVMVEPLHFTVEKRDYIIWCNIPNASKCFKQKKRVNEKTIVAEEVILSSLFQTLRTYFAHLK